MKGGTVSCGREEDASRVDFGEADALVRPFEKEADSLKFFESANRKSEPSGICQSENEEVEPFTFLTSMHTMSD